MPTGDDLWARVSELLAAREGWRLEPQTTPGAPPTWCFGSRAESELSVDVEGGTVSVYVIEADHEVILPDPDALAGWLDRNEPLFASRPTLSRREFDEVLRQRIDEWRREGG